MAEGRRTGIGYYLAAAFLVVLLLAAVGFVVAMVTRPGVEPAQVVVVTDQAPVACPVSQKGTTCFDTQVTNTGGSSGSFVCRLDAAGDTGATFADGATSKVLTVGPDESVHVVSAVTAPGTNPPTAPRVLCTEVNR
jgi:hypothetical protein